MELKGLLLNIKWLLRKTDRFHHRLLVLVDAKAVLSAVAKGRSGSPAFRRPLGSVNAHLLATNSLLRLLYIPSEDNPADDPSRGRRRRPLVRGAAKFCKPSKRERSIQRAMTWARDWCAAMPPS